MPYSRAAVSGSAQLRGGGRLRRLWALAAVLALPAAVLAAMPTTADATAAKAATLASAPPPAATAAVATDTASDEIHLRDGALETGKDVPPPPSLAAEDSAGMQLRLVQFAGAIQPQWYADLAKLGTVVTYIPDNAYLVWTSKAGVNALQHRADVGTTVSYSGPFDPYYRLSPLLKGKDAPDTAQTDITVQAVSNAAGKAAIAAVTEGRQVLSSSYDLGGLVTVSLRVPTAQLDDIASQAPVVNVEPYVAPIMNDEVQDQLLAGQVTTSGGKTVPTGPGYVNWLASHGFPTNPASYPLVDVVDDGIDIGTTSPLHPDYYQLGISANPSRLVSQDRCTSDAAANAIGGHGNLNAGIVGGYNNGVGAANVDAGGYHYGLGVSPYGRLGGIKIFNNAGNFDLSQCSNSLPGIVAKAVAAGAGLTTNSWGANAGGAYNADAQAYDLLTRDASAATAGNQELLHIFSAGNSGSGANTIGSPGTAKNVLTIGATENVRDQGTLDGCSLNAGDNDSDIATFSSRGPTDDGRVKPDLVAAGTHVQGPASQDPGYDGSGVCGATGANNRYYPTGQTLYTWSSGTSHSTPAVAGAASLVQNYYGRVIAPGLTASPAMLKALLANTPRYLTGGVGTGDNLPSNNQGYGVPNLEALFTDTTHRRSYDETSLFTASGQQFARTGTVADSLKPVQVSLAWTDAAGPTVGNAYVNNLDLVVTAGGQTYRGNVFTNGLSVTGGAADGKNNLENVFLPAGTSGPITVTVAATNIAGNGVPGNASPLDQDFALTVANMDTVAQPIAGDAGMSYQESDFDGNTTVDKGEVVNVTATIASAGEQPLTAGTASLSIASGPATLLSSSAAFPAMAPGTAESASYQIRIDPSADCVTPVVLDHTYTAGGGQTVTQHLTINLGGALTATSAFHTLTATDVPKAIPDNNGAGVNSVLTVPATAETVHLLRLKLSITHPFDGDLVAKLTSPAGTVVTLFSGIGSSGDNFTNTVFADDAAGLPPAGGAPYTGTFKPAQPLSVLNGQPLVGNWTLNVSDTAASDVGNLTAWSFDTAPTAAPLCTAGGSGPVVHIGTPGPTVEGDAVDVPVTLLSPDGSAHSVTFTPTNGTATAPGDFDATPVTVTWNPGDPALKHVLVPTSSDGVVEPAETFKVGATTSSIPVSAAVTARILDGPSLSVAAPSPTAEGAGTLSFPVTLSQGQVGGSYSVHVATSDGTAVAGADYTAVSQTLSWAPGDAAVKNVAVPITGDTFDEPGETLTLTLSAPTGATLAPASAAVGTISDDDDVVISVVTPAAVAENAGPLSFPVTITGANPVVSYSVHVATSDGTATVGADYTAVTQTLNWAAGDSATKQVLVPVLNDSANEAAETVVLTLDTAAGASPDVGLGIDTATGTINDDDGVHVEIANADAAAEGGTLHYPVTLTGAGAGQTYTVQVATSGGTATSGSDYTPLSTTLTWNPGDAATKSVSVATTQDPLDEPDETVQVSLSAAAGGLGPVTIDRATNSGTITDDDATPTLTVKKAKVKEGDKGTAKMVFQVTLSAASGSTVSVQFATKDLTASGKDYKKTSGTLTLPAGATTATITVLVKGDKQAEKNEKLALVLSNLLNATPAGPTTVKGKIIDDD